MITSAMYDLLGKRNSKLRYSQLSLHSRGACPRQSGERETTDFVPILNFVTVAVTLGRRWYYRMGP
jgi:hypothetical protein